MVKMKNVVEKTSLWRCYYHSSEKLEITIVAPTTNEIEEHQKKSLKKRVVAIVKKMNQDNKKKQKAHPSEKAIKLNENPFVSQEPNMWLENIDIQHFRNYTESLCEFLTSSQYFSWSQCSRGKTNILEAIYFLALTRSHRTRSDRN